ncbi:MAG: hypothetical protein HKP10_07405 [Kiritimatiellales bacterium]|nr:hypothetical protein [Kiritimatiellales bacterium]
MGLTWLPADNQRIIFTYRSGFDVDYEGDFELAGASAGDFETTVKYPNTFGLGYGIQLTDDIQIEALVEWLQWSVNKTQGLEAGLLGALEIENDWDDTVTVGVGGSWNISDTLIARAGYAFIQTPIPDATITPLLPDADRHAISFGLGYALGSHVIDVAYTFSIYDDRDSTPSGAYDIDSNLVGLTYSLAF